MTDYATCLMLCALAALLYQPGDSELAKRINSASNAAISAILVFCAAWLAVGGGR